ncbi:MAG: Rieske (2Fe-2S) protein [Sphingomonadaceae bacterium]|nr:Rieske (2Fe-2S) protein [Sphingomonadaceae bacterium]
MSAALETVARYERDLGASLTRMFENALDWEHLPHVHAKAFSSIELIEERASGWRANVGMAGGGQLVINLEVTREADGSGGWTTDSFAEGALVGRIVTRATPRGADRCHVAIEFQAPDVGEKQKAGFDAYYSALYAMLYDEDEAMMIAREAAVQRGRKGLAERRKVTLSDGKTAAIPRYCPHLGLPLDAAPDGDGIVTCPWHGYRFDAATGTCVSGAECGWAV